jgi:type IX secretion system PorP/SprF family membrane protein
MRLWSNNIKHNLLALILCLLLVQRVEGQDMHFSQFHAMPLYLNPAMTGFSGGEARVGVIYRNQWFNIGGGTRFETFGAYADIALLKRKLKGDYLGIGITAARDRAGELNLTNTDAKVSLAYAKTFGRRTKHTIAVGLQGGVLLTQFFPSQRAIFSDGIPESIGRSNFAIDMSAGIRYQIELTKRLNLYVGFAYAHITRPIIYALNNKTQRLAAKYVIHAGAQIEANDRFNLVPTALVMLQGTALEVGINAQFIFGDTYRSRNFFSFGLSGRFVRPNGSDAIIPNIKIDYQNIGLGVYYDVNLSDLTRATNTVGALEVSLSYVYQRKNNRSQKTVFCPKF